MGHAREGPKVRPPKRPWLSYTSSISIGVWMVSPSLAWVVAGAARMTGRELTEISECICGVFSMKNTPSPDPTAFGFSAAVGEIVLSCGAIGERLIADGGLAMFALSRFAMRPF